MLRILIIYLVLPITRIYAKSPLILEVYQGLGLTTLADMLIKHETLGEQNTMETVDHVHFVEV